MHRINHLEFELQVSAVELGRWVSERVSLLHSQRIPALIDRVCSELAVAEPPERIDTLELELGSIVLANFDEELLSKLESALRLALRGRPRERAPARTSDERPSASSTEHPNTIRLADARELIECYAWTGNLPWWANAHEPGLIARHLRELLRAPAAWLELLRTIADDHVALARLARACDAELFAAILERSSTPQAVTELITLERLLARLGVQPERTRTLVVIELARHTARLDEPGAPDVKTIPSRMLNSTALLQLSLQALPPPLRVQLHQLLTCDPSPETASLRAAIEHVAAAFPDHTVAPPSLATRDAREPKPEQAIADDSPTRLTIAEPDTRTATSSSTPTTSTSPTTSAEPSLDHPSPAPRRSRPLVPSALDSSTTPPQRARRRALARLDELYVDDAGLVILWPFLERLFTRVELLDDHRRFRDEPTQTQAIALLAYLARAELEPLEHHLALAKLLCGRPPEFPFELETPLAPELTDECERMLAAVIDHAPVLDGMPIPRFRASFLQRNAALSVRTGSWLLQVERQPYDLVLARFSWSWAWLKLPWMIHPLTVEW